MNKVKIGTMAIAFMYTIYHINSVGLNIGNGRDRLLPLCQTAYHRR